MTVAEIDLRVGGTWRYVMIAEGGFEVAFHGEYREIVEPERSSTPRCSRAMPDGEAINVVTFAETDGRTTLELLVRARTGRSATGSSSPAWRTGMQEQMVLLEALAQSLR